MDKNTLTGFGLMALLLIGYFAWNNYDKNQYEKKKFADSVTYAKLHPAAQIDSARIKAITTARQDTAQVVNDAANAALPAALRHTPAQMVTMQNKDVTLQFSTKGGAPVSALLKNFTTYRKGPLYLFNGAGNGVSATLPNPSGAGNIATADLNFIPAQQGPQNATFVADLGNGKSIALEYTLPTEGYLMDCKVRLTGIQASTMPLRWSAQPLLTERDVTTERMQAQVQFQLKGKDHDYFTIKSDGLHKTPENPATWVGYKMHYFSTALVSEEGFSRTDINAGYKAADTSSIATATTTMELPVKGDGTASFKWFMGPNDYNMLRHTGYNLDELVNLGSGIFFFTRYINKWLMIPVFEFFTKFISNYGIILLLLTLFVKLITSFFTYKSYKSSAKMRVLKPELDELRKKTGGDQQKMGVEQMKLYRSAGVSPLGGCLPTLFMLPFLVAMYTFIPNAIDFRGKSFLWAHDLSTFDSILTLPFSWFDHLSLFTLLMTISSLFLALYNRNMTPQDPNNPMMKYMPFIFPVILLGVFNKMAAALTCYYFFSNMLTILQQWVIQNFIIDEKKIHAQMQEARNKPATPSKWAARLEEMQKAQQARAKVTPSRTIRK